MGGLLYRVKFSDFLDLLSKLPAELKKIFNNRTTPRFEADGTTPIHVNVLLQEFRIPAILKDLTTSGLSVIIKQGLGEVRFKAKKVELSFRLPGVSCALNLCGTVVHNRPYQAGQCWGIRFDEKSSGFGVKQDHLLQFIDSHARGVAARRA